MVRLLRDKARAGVRVRILLGDPAGEQVSARGQEEGIDDALAAKVRNVVVLYKPLYGLENVEIRFHDTVLYNSIYRADDQLLVNTHVYGLMASHAPVLHMRRIPGGDMASMYVDSFDTVWSHARPMT